ncbi:MAG TPA: hypothetical protein PLW88_01835 [Syntrophorhabdaceae bacterium]|nr:hypothetical protein [Syntrophorhabdaceae bacterium]HPP06082.1 hypothetical protein [Syntrophorhabdaceae bacterium]
MKEHTINSIREGLDNPDKLEENVSLFSTLSRDEKIALLDAITKSKEEITGRFLNLIYEQEEDKDILKRIRKTLFTLKTKGVKVDEPVKKGPPAINIKNKEVSEDKKIRSFITNYDYYNEMVVFIEIVLKKKNALLIHGNIEFSTGLKELVFTPIGNNELDRLIESIKVEKTDKMAVAETPVSLSYRVLKEASDISKRYMEEIKALKGILKENSIEFEKGFNVYELSLNEHVTAANIEEMFSHPFFELFRFKWDGLDEDKKKYLELKNPVITLPQYMIEEKKAAFIHDLTKKEDIKRLIPSFKTVLEAYAYIFYTYKEYPYYKGLIEYLKKDETLIEVISHLIERELEHKENETYPFNRDNMIVNPFDLMDPYE